MKENKLLIAAVAVMIAAIAWSIIATTGCVMLDRQKDELKQMLTHCQEGWRHCNEERRQLQHEQVIMLADTAKVR